MGLVFDVYAAAAPNGTLLATLTDAKDKQFSVSLDGAGAGQFSLPRSSAQATAAIIAQGNLVKVRLTEVSATAIGAFWMETGRFDLIGSNESGSEMLTFGGAGARAYLSRAIMWNQTFLAGEMGPTDGEWPLYLGLNGPKAGAILRRLIAESISVTRPQQPLPSLSFDFTYTLDSSGATWSATPASGEFIAHVGDGLDQVIAALQSTVPSLVIQMDGNLGLHAYNAFGVDRHSATFATGKVRLEKGINIATALTRELGASKIKTHMLVSGDPTFYGTGSNALTPIREGFASSSGSDVTSLNAIAAGQLALRSANADAIRVGVPYGNTPTTTGTYYPGPAGTSGHYWVGDSITVHTGTSGVDYNESTQRIAEIALGETEAGEVVVEVALGSTYSGSDFARINDVITETRTDVGQLSNEALRYAHSLNAPKVVSVLPTLPDPTFPLGSIVFLTTDTKLYRNTDGSTWSRAVDGADVVAGTILAGAIAAGAVTAEALAATIILGTLIETAGSGRRVEMDTGGIRLYDAIEGLLVNIPTNGSPVFIKGQVEASSLVATANAELQGITSFSTQAVATLQAGVQPPSSPPTLTAGWDQLDLAAVTPPALYGLDSSTKPSGVYYDAAAGASGSTPCYVGVVPFMLLTNNSAKLWQVVEWNAATGLVDRQTTLTGFTAVSSIYGPADACDMTRVGASWYILVKEVTTGLLVGRVNKVTRSSGAQTATATRSGATFDYRAIATDGTVLYVLDYDLGGTGVVETWATTPAYTSSKTLTGSVGGRAGMTSMAYDGTSWWVGCGAGSALPPRVYQFTPATGAVVANTDFPLSSPAQPRGLAWTGTAFVSQPYGATALTFHTSWTWTTASPVYWVAYSWYDDIGTVHETSISNRASIVMGRRMQLNVTTAAIPVGGADDPDKVRVYMAPGASDPGPGALHLQATDALTSRILATYASGGSLDGGGTPFPGSAGATLQSAVGWRVRGNGMQNYGGSTFPGNPLPNDQWYRTDLRDWFRFDGTAWLGPLNRSAIPPTTDIPLTATRGGLGRLPGPAALGGDVYIEDYLLSFFISGGSALSASHNWKGTLNAVTAIGGETVLATADLSSGPINVWRTVRVPINDTVDAATFWQFQTDWTKTGTPGGIYIAEMLTWRYVLPGGSGGGGGGTPPVISNVASSVVGSAATVVQTASNHADTGTSLVLTLGAAPTVGNTLVLGFAGNNGDCSGIVQTGVTWTKINPFGTNFGGSTWLGTAVAGGASATITLTYASGRGLALVEERSGIVTASALDQIGSANGTSTQIASGSVTPTQNNETIFAVGVAFKVFSAGPTNGFASATGSPVASATFNLAVATLQQVAAAAVSTGWTIVSDTWDGGIVSLKTQPAGGQAVSWDVSPAATGQVEYGLTTAYGAVSAYDASFQTSRTLPLTNLATGTTYHYRVHSVDAAGNEVYSSDFTFTTSGAGSSPPTLTNIVATVTGNTTATVSWNVSPNSNGQVEYGLTSAYGSTSTLNASFLAAHSQNLTGLAAATLYHYRVHSVDAGGNSVYSPDLVFTTTGSGGLTRPWAAPSTSGTVNISTGIDHTGATDVTAALQAAIDACPNNRVLQFPTNASYIYKISGRLKLIGRSNLIIDGGGVTLHNVSDANAGGAANSYASSFFWWSWSETQPSDIWIRNFVASGASPSPGVFQTGEHAAFVYMNGGTHIEISGITASGLFGDFVTTHVWDTPGPAHGSEYVWVHDNVITNAGRHYISVLSGRHILFEQNTGGTTGYGCFDIEPESSSTDVLDVIFRNNTFTSYGFNSWVSINGINANKDVDDIVIQGNHITNKALRLAATFATANRVQRLSIIGNTSGVSAAGPQMTIAHVDTLTVTGNSQPLSSGSLFSISDCTNVVSSPNP